MPAHALTPPWKPLGVGVAVELHDTMDKAAQQRGITKRALLESALRRELGLSEPRDGEAENGQGVLPLTA